MSTSFLLQENGFFLLLENSGNIILETASGYRSVISGAIDVALYQQDDGSFDIDLDSDGDLAKTSELDTAILLSLLTDKRADASQVKQPENRRGWWGDQLSDFAGYQIGSLLWLLEQARYVQASANEAKQYIEDCLGWLVTDGYASKVIVTASLVDAGIQVEVKFQ